MAVDTSACAGLKRYLQKLPRACDVCCKTNSNGHKYMWIGYRLHLDVADGQIPINCLLTSASLHDSQAAIPLALITAQRVTSLYDLMDSGYVSEHMRRHREPLGHVPIIDGQKRGSHEFTMAPHMAARFREVMAHIMVGILGLTVEQILRLAPPV